MADLTARPDHWTDALPESWKGAINANPLLNALGRALNRPAPNLEKASLNIFGRPEDRAEADRQWLLQQARGPSFLERMNPVAQDAVNKLGLYANFVGPGVKLPPVAPKPTGIRVYHGSPHDFNAERLVRFPDGRTEYVVGTPDRLPDVPTGAQVVKDFPLGRVRMDKIGTGEGAQAYGHGFYGAESEGVAKSYRDGLSRGTVQAGNRSIPVAGTAGPGSIAYQRQYGNMNLAERMLADHNGNFDRSIRDLMELASIKRKNPKDTFITETPEAYEAAAEQLKAMRSGEWAPPSKGRMYEVRINADPEQFLDWDKPISGQSEPVRRAIEAYGFDPAKTIGQTMHGEMPFSDLRSPQLADQLKRDGIPGIKYLDQGSRLAGEGSRNYVVFDDKLIEILRKYGLLPPVAAGTAAALNQEQPQQ